MIKWGNLSRVFCLVLLYNQTTSKQIKNSAELKTAVTNHSVDKNVTKYQKLGLQWWHPFQAEASCKFFISILAG